MANGDGSSKSGGYVPPLTEAEKASQDWARDQVVKGGAGVGNAWEVALARQQEKNAGPVDSSTRNANILGVNTHGEEAWTPYSNSTVPLTSREPVWDYKPTAETPVVTTAAPSNALSPQELAELNDSGRFKKPLAPVANASFDGLDMARDLTRALGGTNVAPIQTAPNAQIPGSEDEPKGP